MLKISSSLSLPKDAVTQTFAILAKRRAGKSYTARRFAEELLSAGQQVVILDPKGDWWGIRSGADGKSPGFPVIVLGGEHGDLPLEVNAAEVVANLVIEERVSILLDLSDLRKNEVAGFMGGHAGRGNQGFLEAVYRLKAREEFRSPMMLIVDEADAIAPQKPFKGEERMLGAIEDIVRRGGQRGIGCILVSQRSAVLNKNVLTQSQILVAMRTIAPQDLEAMQAWIDVHGTPEQRKVLMESLPSLPTGDAWFWSPGWPGEEGIFRRGHVETIRTFDSGATPEPGKKRVAPKNVADIDLGALQRQMAATIEKAKAEDPKELRSQIGQLRKKISELEKRSDAPCVDVQAEVQTAVSDALREQSVFYNEHLEKLGPVVSDAIVRHISLIREFKAPQLKIGMPGAKKYERSADRTPASARPSRPLPSNNGTSDSALGLGEKKVLAAIAQYPEGAGREQVTVLTGYKRSTRDAYIQRLNLKGFVQFSGAGVTATEAGIQVLGSDYEELPSGADLRSYWLDRLPEGESKALFIAIERYPLPVSREEIGELTGYKRSTRDAYLQRLATRKLMEPVGRGEVRASDHLF